MTKKEQYGMKLENLLNGIKIVQMNLDFLCTLIEYPSEEYQIPDAVEFSHAVVALMNQLNLYDLRNRHRQLDGRRKYVILKKKQVEVLSTLSDDSTEEALEMLRGNMWNFDSKKLKYLVFIISGSILVLCTAFDFYMGTVTGFTFGYIGAFAYMYLRLQEAKELLKGDDDE